MTYIRTLKIAFYAATVPVLINQAYHVLYSETVSDYTMDEAVADFDKRWSQLYKTQLLE